MGTHSDSGVGVIRAQIDVLSWPTLMGLCVSQHTGWETSSSSLSLVLRNTLGFVLWGWHMSWRYYLEAAEFWVTAEQRQPRPFPSWVQQSAAPACVFSLETAAS
jgi:hypothetical protein